MFKTIVALSAIGLSVQAYSMTTKEFTDSLLNRLQENIDQKRAENPKYCESFSRSAIYSELSYADESGTRLLYFNIQDLEVRNFYKIISENFDCYNKLAPDQKGSLFGAFANSGSYRKDTNLIQDALESLAIDEYKEYKSMGEVFGLDNR